MLLGKYELLERIGQGGYGIVYKAQDVVLNVVRAVKVLHPALMAATEFVARFRQEAQMAAGLEHPHIVPVYDLGEDQGSFYLAMKYMPGASLKDRIAQNGRLPFADALEITRQIASTLDFAHGRALIHRDVKPGNILFDANGSARLADFGFAKALFVSGSASLSVSGGMVGTPAYIAPEVWSGRGATPASDLYSLACIFYEMISL